LRLAVETVGTRIPSGKARIALINPRKLNVEAPVLSLLRGSLRVSFVCRFCARARARKETCESEPQEEAPDPSGFGSGLSGRRVTLRDTKELVRLRDTGWLIILHGALGES
jgi:hypothetical protein